MAIRADLRLGFRRGRLLTAASLLVAGVALLAGATAPGEAQPAQPRPFTHERHARLGCLECHGSGPRHGDVRIRSARDCAACHHDPRRAETCAGCHASGTLPSRAVPSTMALSVWPEPGTRPLPFEHPRHARLTCRNCHTAPVTLGVQLECRSCHEDHHRPEAECAQCHRRSEPPSHRRESHLACAGSGCHAPLVRERLTMSRNLCLVCHLEQREHEPGRNCAPCHILSRPPSMGTP
jgi:hypothetical protein